MGKATFAFGKLHFPHTPVLLTGNRNDTRMVRAKSWMREFITLLNPDEGPTTTSPKVASTQSCSVSSTKYKGQNVMVPYETHEFLSRVGKIIVRAAACRENCYGEVFARKWPSQNDIAKGKQYVGC